jgi:uncharacterized protein DUF1963
MVHDSSLRSKFVSALEEAGLAEQRDALLAEARECVHMFYEEPRGEMRVGVSRVGGLPDLPDSVEWPEGTDDEGKPAGYAEFLAQFDLAELPASHGLGLPARGHVWVFMRNSALTQTTGVVIYRDEGEPLRERGKPAVKRATEYGWRDLGVAALRFAPGVSLPLSSRPFQARFRSIAFQLGRVRKQMGWGRIDGQIGGYSYQAEHDMPRQYAIEELGRPEFAFNDPEGYGNEFWSNMSDGEEEEDGTPFLNEDEPQVLDHLPGVRWVLENNEKIQATADAFQLLFMFRPNNRIDLDLGSGFYLEFMMHRDDLARMDFGKVRCGLAMLL